MIKEKINISEEDLQILNSKYGLRSLFGSRKVNTQKALNTTKYIHELMMLQIELIKLQDWVLEHKKKVVVLFEGRDAAGKGGSIKRFKEHLNPRTSRVVALTKPTEVEQGQWYFRRYIKVLPNPGEIVFFDRSWYNRAVVEPVMGFCTKEQYKKFMVQVPEFEHLLYEDNHKIIKFWFSISKGEQAKRFDARLSNPLKQWKYSPVDMKGQELWEDYTFYKEEMFSKTHTNYSPWIIVKANDKKQARLESMRYILSQFEYEGKGDSGISLLPDPNVVMRFNRSVIQLDV